MNARATHRTALLMLLLTNLFWGLSFPLIKAIVFLHERLVPGSGNWFITAMTLAPRFLLGAVFMLAVAWRQVAAATPAERKQGFLLGLSAACGMVFQIDGLQFISASTSAFLTQLYAILIPLYVAARVRRWPGRRCGSRAGSCSPAWACWRSSTSVRSTSGAASWRRSSPRCSSCGRSSPWNGRSSPATGCCRSPR
ncbi:hypothetical protein [Oleiharenicola sp. Vm1]|uniref:hypothetical protein n=1 Tax=Oleiharenicola sp. Vm1 TaxID=3398393 RepID=UPI0039F469AB